MVPGNFPSQLEILSTGQSFYETYYQTSISADIGMTTFDPPLDPVTCCLLLVAG